MLLATLNLFRGKVDAAVEHLLPSVRSFSTGSSNTAGARNMTARVLLIKNEATQALEQARQAQVEGKGQSAEWEGIFMESMTLGRLGRMNEAEQAADRLVEERLPSRPSRKNDATIGFSESWRSFEVTLREPFKSSKRHNPCSWREDFPASTFPSGLLWARPTCSRCKRTKP